MKEVRNTDGKLVCRVDEKKCLVEIVCSGCMTKIRFVPGDDTLEIKNYRMYKVKTKLKR
jgi:hypothetical protein